MTTPTEYPIRSLADFLTVPADRIGDCLCDFALWLKVARQPGGMTRALEADGFGPTTFNTELFIWIDDGVPGITALQFSTEDETLGRLAVPRPATPAPANDVQALEAVIMGVLDRAGPMESKTWVCEELVTALTSGNT